MTYDLEQLLLARLYVARLGESDVKKWWRTDGILGPDGAFVGPRVVPLTHPTARARIAFAVARHACSERYPERGAQHLFELDPVTEDRLDALLVEKLGQREWWLETVARLEAIDSEVDVAAALTDAQVVTEEDLESVDDLNLGPANRSLPIPGKDDPAEQIRLLTAGFVRSTPGELAVPYIDSEVEV